MHKLIPTLGLVLGLGACGDAGPEAPAPTPFDGTNGVHEVMEHVLDPAADVIWDSAGYILTHDGEEDLSPTTDEGWHAVENAATVVMESGNLLILPGRAVDGADWTEISLGLVTAGAKARAAAEAKDKDALFEAGGMLYQVCLACHTIYIVGDE